MKGKLFRNANGKKEWKTEITKIGSSKVKLPGSIWLSNIFPPLPQQLCH